MYGPGPIRHPLEQVFISAVIPDSQQEIGAGVAELEAFEVLGLPGTAMMPTTTLLCVSIASSLWFVRSAR
jgi:hypothetical protein